MVPALELTKDVFVVLGRGPSEFWGDWRRAIAAGGGGRMAASPGCGGLSGGRESASPEQVVVDGERREVDCVGATFSAETRHEQAMPCMLPPTRQQ